MATQTTNYGLTKPSYNETADIGVINSNMDIIDAKIKENADNVSTLATEVDGIKSDVVCYEQSGYLSKNLINPTLQTITRSGVTCTNNGDGTYTLNGTCTEATNIGRICTIGKSFPMDLRFLGVPNGCNSYLAIGIEGESNKTINNGRSVLIQANKKIKQVDFWINQGDTLDNVVFKPMLTTDLNATYDDFTPYAPSNIELQSEVDEIDNRVNNNTRRTRRNITSDLANLPTAIAEQDLAKYGYAIGDYFVGASGYYYYLADMNTNYGGYNYYAVVDTNHCGIVVDTKSTCQWLSEGTVTNYSSSTLHAFLTDTALPNIKSDIATLFGDWESHLIKRNELDNAIGGWGTEWNGLKDCLICAMTEVQMYGSRIFSYNGYQIGTGSKALELFRKYRFNEIYGNVSIWLKSIDSEQSACLAVRHGRADKYFLSDSNRASGLILFH